MTIDEKGRLRAELHPPRATKETQAAGLKKVPHAVWNAVEDVSYRVMYHVVEAMHTVGTVPGKIGNAAANAAQAAGSWAGGVAKTGVRAGSFAIKATAVTGLVIAGTAGGIAAWMKRNEHAPDGQGRR